MTISVTILETLTYALACWLGLYLVARNPADPRLRLAGLGLVTYALSLASDLLVVHAPTPALTVNLARLHWPLLFLPSLFWFGAMVYLLPEPTSLRAYLSRMLSNALLPAAIPFYLFSAGTSFIFDFTADTPRAGPAYFIFAAVVLLPLLAALFLAEQTFRSAQPKKPLGLLLLATLFFTLSAGLLIFPLNWLPRSWLLLAISLDFIILGLVIALLDALAEGEALLPDFLRSFDFSSFTVLLFGGLVTLTMVLSTGINFPMLTLLLATITAAIAMQTFSDHLQTAFDKVAFNALPRLRQERASFRAFTSALPRANTAIDPTTLDGTEFTRLTRRALSHMGNLPRLATNPLTRMPLIDTRLAQRKAGDNTLERAAELKSLLAESIARLKPRHKGDFGTAEEWRHYNALYFPYVAGLKPYSRRAEYDGLEPAAQEALDWFRTYIPERTLYNWQNAAAKLVAQDLRERA
jgi:hypothetical protein